MDLRSYIRLLLRRWPVFLVVTIVVGAAIGAGSFFIPPVYTATAQVSFAPALPANTTMTDRRTAATYVAERMETYAQAVSTAEVLRPVIIEEDLDLSVGEFVRELAVTVPTGTTVMNISANGATAEQAASIADSVAANLPPAIAALEGAASVASSPVEVSVLQAALPPEQRTSPNLRLNLVVAAVIALFVGVLAAVLVDNFDTRIRRGRDVTALGMPYLGGVPVARGDEVRDLLHYPVQTPERKAFLRRVAIDVLFLSDGSPAHVLVTSALPGAGKTTVAASLAAALAEAGNHVVYIDADIRGGRLASQLRLPQTHGITDVVAGKTPLDEALLPWDEGGFTIIPCGASLTTVSDLLAADRFAQALTELDREFDVVIVDAPPITNASEATRFTQHLRNVVVVAEAVETRRADLMRVVTSLRHAGATITGVVLDRVSSVELAAATPAEIGTPDTAELPESVSANT
ncbi:tyrosine-protein kinase domain-containing protein [Microbacterium sp. GXF7504]